MSIDERLDRLTERHEALTMNLELLAREVQDLRSAVEKLHRVVEKDAENIRSLARIAEIDERRLTDLEGGER
jgi:archaellum component FlaC